MLFFLYVMRTLMFGLVFLAAIAIPFLEAIRCQSCYDYNGQVCMSNPDCIGKFCLFEQIIRPNGVVSTRKACSAIGQYQFDDGTLITNLNQCVTRTSILGQYYVLLCSSGDDCNSQCLTTIFPTSQPVPEFAEVSCYDCVSYDGTDCQTGLCQGKFCLYERRISNNDLMIRKSCLNSFVMLLDDGTVFDIVGMCEVRTTFNAQYYLKICDDSNMCNDYCNPPVTIETQRQPLISCYECETYGDDCFTGQCTARYCIYERQRRLSTGTAYVRKACTNFPFIEYPDSRPSTALNTCETRIINDVQYQVRVCSSSSNCNVACPANDVQLVTCYECEAVDEDDCNSGSCQAKYCLFTRTQSSTSIRVKKSCTNADTLLYVHNIPYTSFGNCEYRWITAVSYDYKLCNSTSYCNSPCSPGPFVSPLSSATALFSSLLVCFAFSLLLEEE